MLVFACFSPHPPLLLPEIGSLADREKVKKTLDSLAVLKEKLAEKKPEAILISSPHQDWGFNVPLRLLAPSFSGGIKKYQTGTEPPRFYFEAGRKTYNNLLHSAGFGINRRLAVIGSGDLSHCLRLDGPYGFHPDGPKFDETLIEFLKEKNLEGILKLNENFSEAAECGLRSFAFILGILKESLLDWEPEILSYEGPFGVGYLVANFKF